MLLTACFSSTLSMVMLKLLLFQSWCWRGFLGTAMLTSGAGFLGTFSPNYILFLIFRFLVGVGLGSGSVFASWFLEFVPADNRGKWMVVFSTFWTFGTIFEASLASGEIENTKKGMRFAFVLMMWHAHLEWIVMSTLNWRWLLAFSSLPAFVVLVFYSLAPESPSYLCMKGKTTDALRILEKMAQLNQRKLPSGLLVSTKTDRKDEEFAPTEEVPLLSSTRKNTEVVKNCLSTVCMPFSPNLTQTTLLLWMFYFGNVFSYYGIILLTSELSSRESKCELPGLLLSVIIVDRVSRKLSFIIMLTLACIFLLPLVFHQSAVLTTGLLFGARMCSMRSITVAYIYGSEIYPASMRTTWTGIASSMGRIGGMICPLVAVVLVTGCRQTAAIILFEVVTVLSAICAFLFPVDTKGRELSDTIGVSKSKEVLVVGD
ncbi:hypothetical protein RGQ29_006764 [Quercus rubra]|uniref:Major facilitator superfamily (MFS) profile domain-containing protein n=1 Tax=Quercus rubra TaxID=3512 RepID=A0AAN7E8Z8_QUERU|nr:hypothetical protein RGQ29_006764 [Quercus rubra]